jgi:hypothetical protein
LMRMITSANTTPKISPRRKFIRLVSLTSCWWSAACPRGPSGVQAASASRCDLPATAVRCALWRNPGCLDAPSVSFRDPRLT